MTSCWQQQQQQYSSIELYEQLTEVARGGVITKRKTSNETCSSCCSISDYTIETTVLPTVTELVS